MTSISPITTPLITTPSGLLVPAPAAPPAGTGTVQETTPSGIIIVRNQLSPVSVGSALVVATKPITGDGALQAAKAAHAELAAAQGGPAADIVLGKQVEMATQVRNDEIRAQAVAAMLAGDLAAAAALLAGTH